jgi:phosphopantothenoylcysteine synthetase/decarboxylase
LDINLLSIFVERYFAKRNRKQKEKIVEQNPTFTYELDIKGKILLVQMCISFPVTL